eukprot:4031759-Prymnesium_polylepis.2
MTPHDGSSRWLLTIARQERALFAASEAAEAAEAAEAEARRGRIEARRSQHEREKAARAIQRTAHEKRKREAARWAESLRQAKGAALRELRAEVEQLRSDVGTARAQRAAAEAAAVVERDAHESTEREARERLIDAER